MQEPVGVAGGIPACVEQADRTDGLEQTRPSLAVCNIQQFKHLSLLSGRWQG